MEMVQRVMVLPKFTPQERAALLDFWAVWEANYDEIQAAVAAVLQFHPDVAAVLRSGPRSELEKQGLVTRDRVRKGMVDGDVGEYVADLRATGRRLAHAGVDLATWIDISGASKAAVMPKLFAAYRDSPARVEACVQVLNRWADMALSILADEFLSAKQAMISKQSSAILELSTPILEIEEGRLIVPLVGAMDAERAKQMTERLLAAVRAHRTRVVIIDITGVASVDSGVANHLIQTAEAARLMGAKVLFTGLSGEVARTLVALGLDVQKLTAYADLRSGTEAADRL